MNNSAWLPTRLSTTSRPGLMMLCLMPLLQSSSLTCSQARYTPNATIANPRPGKIFNMCPSCPNVGLCCQASRFVHGSPVTGRDAGRLVEISRCVREIRAELGAFGTLRVIIRELRLHQAVVVWLLIDVNETGSSCIIVRLIFRRINKRPTESRISVESNVE